jgi:hypothetical protein
MAGRILTFLIATRPCILTSASSTNPYDLASPNAERSPTTSFDIQSFGVKLKPRYIFGAGFLD